MSWETRRACFLFWPVANLKVQLGPAKVLLRNAKETPLYWPEREKHRQKQGICGICSSRSFWSTKWILSCCCSIWKRNYGEPTWNWSLEGCKMAGFAFVELEGWLFGSEFFRLLWSRFAQMFDSAFNIFQPRWTCPECVLCWLPALWPLWRRARWKSSKMLLGIIDYLYELWSGRCLQICFEICFQCCLEGGETKS